MSSLAVPVSSTTTQGSTQMALQERQSRSTLTSMMKLPLQRLRPAIGKYLKMLDIHLHRLHQHQCNMEKLANAEQWTQLHEEQVRATYTMQQIKATLQELHRTRSQVVDNQLVDFHALLQEFNVKVMAAVGAFLHFCQGKPPDDSCTGESNSVDSSTVSATTHVPALAQTQASTCTCSVPDNTCAAASRDQLRQEMEELHALVLHFVHTVCVTTDTGESTENDNSEIMPTASPEIKILDKKSKLKMAVLPVVGALLGGAVAGPVGLFTGIKIGTLAGTVGGGVAGLASGTIFTSQNKTSSKAPDPDHKDDHATKDVPASISPPSPTKEHIPITQQSSSQHTTPSISTPSSTQSSPQMSTTQSDVDNRRDQPCANNSSDDNGNMSLWDQLMFWGQTPQPDSD